MSPVDDLRIALEDAAEWRDAADARYLAAWLEFRVAMAEQREAHDAVNAAVDAYERARVAATR